MSTGTIEPGVRRFSAVSGAGDELLRDQAGAGSGLGAALRSDRSNRAPSRKPPAGLIGALGLILAIEAIVGQMAGMTRQRTRLSASWQSAIRAASGPEGRAEVLCFGDSLVKLGILPRVLEERLGSSAYNLAVLGGQAPNSYFLLRRVLEQGHRPRAVIVNFSALLLAMDPRVNVECWSDATGRDRLELARWIRDPVLAASMMIKGLVPSCTARGAVRAAMGLDMRPDPGGGGLPDDRPVFERNWRINRGAQVAPRPFVPVEGALPQPSDGRDWRWRPLPVHTFYVERFLSLAQSHRIPVYWVLTPAVSAWRDRNERSGTAGAYRQFVRGYLSRFPGLIVLDGEHVSWDCRAFRDPIHLNRDGAVRLSLAVAESMARRSGGARSGTRWIELDGVAAPPPGSFQDCLEDLDQSRLVVARQDRGEIAREASRW